MKNGKNFTHEREYSPHPTKFFPMMEMQDFHLTNLGHLLNASFFFH